MKKFLFFFAIVMTSICGAVSRAELVYENDAPRGSGSMDREEERSTLREVIVPSEKLRSTKRSRVGASSSVTTVQIQQSNPVQVQPLNASAALASSEGAQAQEAAPAEVQNLSKSELMRRERVRKEIENEDLLQERLESLRLRDERQRSDQILSAGSNAGTSADAPAASAYQPNVSTEVVVPPATERPGQSAQVPAINSSTASNASVSSVSNIDSSDPSEKVQFIVQPRIGVANMNGNGLYDIRPRYSAGIALGLGVSEHLIFEFGYQYNEYGFAIARSNPAVNYVNGFGINTNSEQIEMHQNVFDLGAKIPFLSMDSKVRPFVGLGVGYSKSYTNFSSAYLRNLDAAGLGNTWGRDYETSAYLGYLSTGLDFRVSKSITIGATFKYYNVFSSRQNSSINNYGLLGVEPRYYNNSLASGLGGAPSELDKRYIGGSLERASFYTLLVGAGFSF